MLPRLEGEIMDDNLKIKILTIIICIAVICAVILMIFDGRHIRINTDNNTTLENIQLLLRLHLL